MSELTRERNREGGGGRRGEEGGFGWALFRGNQKEEDETDVQSAFHLVKKEDSLILLYLFIS